MNPKSLLTKIEGGEKPAYLFGTMHVYDPAIFVIPEIVYNAIDECDIFAPEVNSFNVPYQVMVRHMTIEEGKAGLDKLLTPESYKKVLDLPSSKGQEDLVRRLKPIYVNTLIMTSYDKPFSSIDRELFDYAGDSEKQIEGLETLEEHMAAIDSVPLEEQAEMLEKGFHILDNIDIEKMMIAYKNQDFKVMIDYMEAYDPSSLFVEMIQIKRNIEMCKRIDTIIKNGDSVFAAVGALHLPDTKDASGMLGLLKDMGYKITSIPIEL